MNVCPGMQLRAISLIRKNLKLNIFTKVNYIILNKYKILVRNLRRNKYNFTETNKHNRN